MTRSSPDSCDAEGGQLEQRLRDPARDVGEDQVGEHVVRPAQPAGEHPQQLLGDLGALPIHSRSAVRPIVYARTSVTAVADEAWARIQDRKLAEGATVGDPPP